MHVPAGWFVVAERALYNGRDRVDTTRGCRQWTGATDDGGYGMLCLKDHRDPTVTQWKTYRVHRLVFILAIRQADIPRWIDVSHLCHNRLCFQLSHLNLEPRKINRERTKCNRDRQCRHHVGYPDCLL